MSKVSINQAVLNWAVDRSGRTLDALQDRFPRIREWAAGERLPTLRQVEDLARATSTPLGFLFLDTPPEESLPIRHFRTVDAETPNRPSPDLLETFQTMHLRQAWMREFLVEQGQEPLSFVGSAQLGDDPAEIARLMRLTLDLDEEWAAQKPTWPEASSAFRGAMEAVGILVVVNGIVGNNTHRKLDPGEFRGFVLVDDYAPLVFVNGVDAKAAQMFTLAHELAHLLLGSSAAFDLRDMQPADDPTELACNRAAAEFLVPTGQLRRYWPSIASASEPFNAAARHFKVSMLVAARRALDMELIKTGDFLTFYREYQKDERRAATRRPEGGDFYANQNFRVGRRFASEVVRAAREGRLLYSEAYRLTGLYGDTFERYAFSLDENGA